MTIRMAPRGPDAEGLWEDEGVVLGHRRLAILDLDARANQPMLSSDGRYAIVFNGEIYNFRELRRGLEAKDITFRTTSDTEVLLAIFALEGEAKLLEALGPHISGFAGGAGKAMLAKSPEKALPEFVTHRPKSGFSIPMAQWLSGAADTHAWADVPMLAAPGTPWARRWAKVVMEGMTG